VFLCAIRRSWFNRVKYRILRKVGAEAVSEVCQIEQFYDTSYRSLSGEKKKELTPEQLSSVSCPTSGVVAGKRCVLHSGAPRSEPHVDRKFAAAESIERK
jgi:hypothetical protein